jgi:hypothetical protein
MAGMRRLIAAAVMVAGLTLSVCAQRGGGHSSGGVAGHSSGFAGHGGGFASHSAPAFRGAAAPMGRVNFMGSPRLSANRYAAAPRLSPGSAPVARYPERGPSSSDRHSGYRRPYTPVYGLGLPTGFSVWPGSLLDSSFLDSGFYDGPGFYNPSGYGDSGYVNPAPPPDYASGPYAAPPVEQAGVAPPDAYRPAYEKPLEPEAAVTLVFKDGRPNQQIHNYMLTRTTLYVQDERRREIPVDDLDLAVTQKINKEDGIDFQLPGISR